MPVMRLGLIVGALATVLVTWMSVEAGFTPETALLRGLLAFMAVTFVAYLGALVIATAPPAPFEGTAEERVGAPGTADTDGRAPAVEHGDRSREPVAIDRARSERKAA